jgi:hypothetical protein
VCINMAEAIGFIMGEYMIPTDLPLLFITDSNNAHTLRRNISNKDQFTHQAFIRKVKQGIDQSIAAHMEYLTSQWMREESLDTHMIQLYKKGEKLCKLWDDQNMSRKHEEDNHNIKDDDTYSSSSSSNTLDSAKTRDHITNAITADARRYHFDCSMFDQVGRITIMKVFSHQLNSDLTIRNPNGTPSSNLFAATANQIADNIATSALCFYASHQIPEMDDCFFYPPFAPEWCFSFEGLLTNKGATKILFEKIDEELTLRLKHRPKHGLFYLLRLFNSLHTDLIGDDTLYRKMVKMTALCWTRCGYRFPPLIQQIWKEY